jgi:2-polyprenyl-6-methoxyphenol hydroxylase-like FAD-dependent oxidoreductase
MHIAIVGAGGCGLSLALNLHKRGICCHVYERAPKIRELGVGITLLPHAMREFTALGVGDELLAAGIENETTRVAATGKVVRISREHPPDFITIQVEELVGDRPFVNLDDYISQEELRAL